MHEWAEAHPKSPVLIAGHTHRPIFKKANEDWVADIDALERELEAIPMAPERRVERATKHKELEAAKARARTTPDLAPSEMETPCYFNTGCASFGDGSVTAVEIANRRISLVRWPWPYGDQELQREELDSADLEDVFELVTATRASSGPGPFSAEAEM